MRFLLTGTTDLSELTEMPDMQEINKNLGLLEKALEELPSKALALGLRVALTIFLFLVGSKVINIIRALLKKGLEKANIETGIIQFLDGLVKSLLYLLLVVSLAGNFGFDAASIVALLGSVGVAVGLAIQGSLSNLAGGVLILLLKPFKVGDYIIEDSNKNEGTVMEISIFYTKLQTVDHKIIVLPNGVLANSSLTNVTSYHTRRVDLLFGISYDADIRTAKSVISKVIENDTHVIKDEPITIFVDSLGASDVVIGARCYCNTEDYWTVRWRLIEEIKYALDEANIEIPYQQVSVHMAK